MIVEFKHDTFSGKSCMVDEDFVPMLKEFGDLAKSFGFKIIVTNSFAHPKDKLSGTVVNRVSHSNHFIGQAIDCNIMDYIGKIWTHELLKNPTEEIARFISKVKGIGFRWGGDFHDEDRVHFDSGLNLKNPEIWKKKFNEFQLNK